jgi:DNA-binding NarL/FixJ family response regulator
MRQSTDQANPLTEFHLFDSAYLKIAYGRLFQSKYWVTAQKRLGLSNREIQVGILMVKGLETEDIADSLKIGEGTVRTHIKAIKLKLAVSTKVQTVVKLILATGILTEDI